MKKLHPFIDWLDKHLTWLGKFKNLFYFYCFYLLISVIFTFIKGTFWYDLPLYTAALLFYWIFYLLEKFNVPIIISLLIFWAYGFLYLFLDSLLKKSYGDSSALLLFAVLSFFFSSIWTIFLYVLRTNKNKEAW